MPSTKKKEKKSANLQIICEWCRYYVLPIGTIFEKLFPDNWQLLEGRYDNARCTEQSLPWMYPLFRNSWSTMDKFFFCSRLLMYPKKYASSCQRSSIGLRSRDLGGTFWPPIDVANVSRIIRARQLVCFGSLSCLKRSLSGKVSWMDATALLLNCDLPVRTIFQKLSPGEWTWTFGRTLCHCPICLQSLLYICSLFPKSHSPIDKLLFGSWLYNVTLAHPKASR